eukprot:gb/GFBE01034265.1/.p1 GENE.gb/GFBE01034265.1/~~gb/GFBE01034265.1/.p1  ORF type:complete len:281 (+),score=41.99 gb/GFBE01034265.1/:1-843(+)
MALRPYDGNAARRGASESGMASSRRGGGGGGGGRDTMGAMAPFSGGATAPFAGGAMAPFGSMFGGHDPFKEFSAMPFGGGLGGSMMSRFDQMAEEMMKGFGPGMGPGSARGGGGFPGAGSYSCQSYAMSSVTGADGKVHTEKYSSSDVGNTKHGIREAQHAYSNSSTGMDKMGLERHLGDRARKMVKERDRNTMEERSSEMLRGMDEGGRDAFDRDFHGKAQHLPPHGRFNMAGLPGSSHGGALPGGAGRHMMQLPAGPSGIMGSGSARGHSMPGSGRRR